MRFNPMPVSTKIHPAFSAPNLFKPTSVTATRQKAAKFTQNQQI